MLVNKERKVSADFVNTETEGVIHVHAYLAQYLVIFLRNINSGNAFSDRQKSSIYCKRYDAILVDLDFFSFRT